MKKNPSRTSHASGLDTSSKLMMSCSARSPGDYQSTVILTSNKKSDIRVYQIAVHVKPKKHMMTL